MKKYEVVRGNGAARIDLYEAWYEAGEFRERRLRTVVSGIRPQKLGEQIAGLLNNAYRMGKEDGKNEG